MNVFEKIYPAVDSTVIVAWVFRAMLASTAMVVGLDVLGVLGGSAPSEVHPLETLEVTRQPVERPDSGSERIPLEPGAVPVEHVDDSGPTLPNGEPLPSPMIGRMILEHRVTGDGVPYIVGSGDFGSGTFKQFQALYQANGSDARYLVISSRGGLVEQAIDLGHFLRAEGIKVIVPHQGYCLSACTLALAGGIERVVYPSAFVGVHQWAVDGAADGTPHELYVEGQSDMATQMLYFEEMGVSSRVGLWAAMTPPEEITLISNAELAETRLATIVSSNIRMRL